MARAAAVRCGVALSQAGGNITTKHSGLDASSRKRHCDFDIACSPTDGSIIQTLTMFHITSGESPVGSSIFSVFALLGVSLIVLLILRHYLPLRTTPGFYLVPIFFALWLPSIVVLLVPIDLASRATTDDDATRGIWLPERVILVSWRITYWLTFALTW